MSEKVKSLKDAMAAKKAKAPAEAESQQFVVNGEAPYMTPHVGQTVEFTWADPNMIGTPKVQLAMFVSSIVANSPDGRLHGWILMDPSMTMPGPNGRPVQVPPLIPVGNVPYSRAHKAMTWRFHGDTPVD